MPLLAALLLCTVFQLFAEIPDAPNKLDDSGKRTGRWVQMFDRYWKPVRHEEDCVFYRVLDYENGKPKGLVSDYYRNGTLRMKTRLESIDPDAFADTTVTLFHENGMKQAQGAFRGGKQNGVWITWHDNGNKSSEGFYIDGKLNGDWQKWYPDGTPEGKGAYKNNFADGKWIMWYPDGKKRSEGVIRLERKQGIWKEWDELGNRDEGEYDNDLRTGYWTEWDSTDFMVAEGDYLHGRRDGVWRLYQHDDTTIRGKYINDVREGNWMARDANGKLIWLHEYKRGVPRGQWVDYQSDGSYCEGIIWGGLRQGIWRWYNRNGILLKQCEFEEGQQVGESLIYDESGSLREVHHYRMWTPFDDIALQDDASILEGESSIYYPDSTLLCKIPYRNGLKQGVSSYYLQDGTVRTEVEYDLGSVYGYYYRLDDDSSWCEGKIYNSKRNGVWKEYDAIADSMLTALWLDDKQMGLSCYENADGSVETGVVYDSLRIGWWAFEPQMIMQKYDTGKPDGEFLRFDKTRNLWEKGSIIHGLRVGHWQLLDETGAVVAEGDYKAGKKDGIWLETYVDNNYAVGMYVAGKKHGKWSYYSSANKPVAEGNLEHGLRQGFWIERTPDGNVLQGIYINGEREGEWSLIDSMGRLYAKGVYVDGKKTGEWVLFDKSGAVMKRIAY